jgi:alkane 1-monooxygenase
MSRWLAAAGMRQSAPAGRRDILRETPIMPRMTRFALATLIPVPLLLAGAVWGGLWLWAAFLHVTVLTAVADRLAAAASPGDGADGGAFPLAGLLSEGLALAHLVLLPLAIWALATQLSGREWLLAFFAFGLFFGQVGTANAHDLIHRGGRWPRALGAAVFVSLLFGHHVSAHRLVHHAHVGTPKDPNSPRLGRSYWGFLPRAWVGSFRAGLAAERALSARGQGTRVNPYVLYVGAGGALAALAWMAFGAPGLGIYLALSFHAQSQLLMSDYVQHYGLRRARLADGRLEPVGARHSWNAGHWMSSALTLNAPRHSDHHAHPARAYPLLRLPDDAPMLPGPLPVMGLIALFPPLWRRIMDPRVRAVMDGAPAQNGSAMRATTGAGMP